MLDTERMIKMELGLAGRTAIVTGGGSNIGRAIVLALVREGVNVVIAEKSMVDGEKVANQANSLGRGRTLAVTTDVTRLNAVKAMIDKTIAEFKRIDVLVNNVGWDAPEPFIESTPKLWDSIITLNFRSMLNCCKIVLPHMIEQKGGAVINMSSDAALGQAKLAVYGGCKGAIISFSKSIAKEVGPFGIRVNTVCPGLIPPMGSEDTGIKSMWRDGLFGPEIQKKIAMTLPLGRLGRPTDIAEAVVFLASDVAAGYITGETLTVDGGHAVSADLFAAVSTET
jgi:2-hydroxycyclohexanecarboxyl-CoA dehydrogenase